MSAIEAIHQAIELARTAGERARMIQIEQAPARQLSYAKSCIKLDSDAYCFGIYTYSWRCNSQLHAEECIVT